MGWAAWWQGRRVGRCHVTAGPVPRGRRMRGRHIGSHGPGTRSRRRAPARLAEPCPSRAVCGGAGATARRRRPRHVAPKWPVSPPRPASESAWPRPQGACASGDAPLRRLAGLVMARAHPVAPRSRLGGPRGPGPPARAAAGPTRRSGGGAGMSGAVEAVRTRSCLGTGMVTWHAHVAWSPGMVAWHGRLLAARFRNLLRGGAARPARSASSARSARSARSAHCAQRETPREIFAGGPWPACSRPPR